jgi:hypothetical protein
MREKSKNGFWRQWQETVKEIIARRVELEFDLTDDGTFNQANYLSPDIANWCRAEILEFLGENGVLAKINDDILEAITPELDLDRLLEWAVKDYINSHINSD